MEIPLTSPLCSFSVDHSSPIPIPTPSPNTRTEPQPNEPNEGPKSVKMEILTLNEVTSTKSNAVRLSSQQLKRLNHYRSHSFQRMSSLQWMSLINALIMISSFFLIPFPAFPPLDSSESVPFKIMWTAAKMGYPVILALTLFLYAFLSATDSGLRPTSQVLALSASERRKGIAGDDNKFWCFLCEEVRVKGTKHCYSCRKCVDGFDHHCPFLNTCIGSKNYALFIGFSSAMEMGCCLQVLFHCCFQVTFSNHIFY